MIDFETLFFMKCLDEMAVLSRNGIRPFSEASEKNQHDYIFYDEQMKGRDAGFPVVLDMLIDENHHDIISWWNDQNYDDDYTIGVLFDDKNKPYVQVRSGNYNSSVSSWLILIEDGRWYFG